MLEATDFVTSLRNYFGRLLRGVDLKGKGGNEMNREVLSYHRSNTKRFGKKSRIKVAVMAMTIAICAVRRVREV